MNKLYKFLIKTQICFIIFLSLAIVSKKNITYKERIKKELYENHISFSNFKKLYNHYLGGILPLEKLTNQTTEPVFNEKLTYTKASPYIEGVSLEVSDSYLIPSQQSGIVVYTGEKENYGKVIIIEDENNLNIWYGNICNSSLKLYDNIKKGTYIGTTCNNKLYLVYSKDNKFLDYKDYL